MTAHTSALVFHSNGSVKSTMKCAGNATLRQPKATNSTSHCKSSAKSHASNYLQQHATAATPDTCRLTLFCQLSASVSHKPAEPRPCKAQSSSSNTHHLKCLQHMSITPQGRGCGQHMQDKNNTPQQQVQILCWKSNSLPHQPHAQC